MKFPPILSSILNVAVMGFLAASAITTSAVAVELPLKTASSDKNSITFLNSKPANAALPFSDIVLAGETLFMSGQIGFDPKTGALAPGGFEAEAHQTMKNIKNTLENYGYSMSQVVKCTVMLTDINDFARFNKIYTQYFVPPYPARSAFAVKELALNSLIEVECIAHL